MQPPVAAGTIASHTCPSTTAVATSVGGIAGFTSIARVHEGIPSGDKYHSAELPTKPSDSEGNRSLEVSMKPLRFPFISPEYLNASVTSDRMPSMIKRRPDRVLHLLGRICPEFLRLP